MNKNILFLLTNIKALISSHNKRILNSQLTRTRTTVDCPVGNKCLTKNTIYEAKITPENGDPKIYIGSTRRTFKPRFNEYKNSFPKPNRTKPLHCTKLANYLWDLRHKNNKYKVSWKILKRTNSKYNRLEICTLCNLERLHIAAADSIKILNKINELVTQCPHHPKEFF